MNSDLQTQPSVPVFADVPVNQIARLLHKQEFNFPVWSLQLQTHVHFQITLIQRKQTCLLFPWFTDKSFSETRLITKSFLDKLKHIPYWSLNERPSGTLNESNKKIGIFRLEENSPISLWTVSFEPKYFWFWIYILCYQGKCSGK